ADLGPLLAGPPHQLKAAPGAPDPLDPALHRSAFEVDRLAAARTARTARRISVGHRRGSVGGGNPTEPATMAGMDVRIVARFESTIPPGDDHPYRTGAWRP